MRHSECEHLTEPFSAIQRLLPSRRLLTANSATRTLICFALNGQPPLTVLIEQRFSSSEWRVVLPLLQGYPRSQPYDRLLSALHGITPARGREQLQAAQRNGRLRETLRPLRDIISRLRPKLKEFSLDIATRQGNGYILIVQTNSLTSGEI